jgi:hypothetical protein
MKGISFPRPIVDLAHHRKAAAQAGKGIVKTVKASIHQTKAAQRNRFSQAIAKPRKMSKLLLAHAIASSK